MPDELIIGVVATPRQWRGELQSHVRNHVSGVRLTVLREARAAFEEEMDVVVVDDVASVLNRLNLKRLRERGVRVVGVYDPEEDEGAGRRFLEDLGVDLAVTADASAEELLEGIASLGPAIPAFDAAEIEGFLAELPQAADGAALLEPAAPLVPESRSNLIVVGGAPGAGATEVAIGLGRGAGGTSRAHDPRRPRRRRTERGPPAVLRARPQHPERPRRPPARNGACRPPARHKSRSCPGIRGVRRDARSGQRGRLVGPS